MDISVIIVSWNVRDLLKKCLESIFARTQTLTPPSPPDQVRGELWKGEGAVEYEVIVVDNGSTNGTTEMLKANFDVIPAQAGIQESKAINSGSPIKSGMTVKLIRNAENKGFAAANNQGIREAKGEFILLLNPDTKFIEDSLSKVVEMMRRDESIGVLGCKLLNPDGTIQPSVRRFPRLRDVVVIFLKLHKVFPGLLDKYLARDFVYHPTPTLPLVRGGSPPSSPLAKGGVRGGSEGGLEVDQVMGAFFCVRKKLFDKIGLLDGGYFLWFEEVDFCRRAREAGYKVVYWSGTSVIHHGGQSFAQQMTLKKQWWFFRSAWRYFKKNYKLI